MADAEAFADRALSLIEASCRPFLTELTTQTLENAKDTLTSLHRNILRMTSSFPQMNELAAIVQNLIATIEDQKELTYPGVTFMRARQQATRGRPLYLISQEQLEFFIEAGFTRKQMANMLHVSISSIKRRLRQYNLGIQHSYSNVTNDELDALVHEVTKDNPSLGQRMVQGILRSQGNRVQRQRVADSLIRVDEVAVALRWARSIRRRVYKVAGPNSLWHIDGNHKLIRWGFVIHGGIDGFSRLCTFIQVATNNRSSSMMKAFLDGIAKYGLPSRVRADKGLENTGVGAYMLAARGPNRGSFITGKGVHNQRIERLWRDVYSSCTNVFHRLFLHMEDTGILRVDNDVHLWCLHYVFTPRIQQALNTFRNAWNCHRLSDAKGKTPTQLFIQGVLGNAGQGHRGVDDLLARQDVDEHVDPDAYGIDEDGPIPRQELEFELPTINAPINENMIAELDVIVQSYNGDNLGLELFENVLNFIEQA